MTDNISSGFRLAHTMMRVMDMEKSLEFYCGILGMQVLRRTDYPEGKFTNTFIGYGPEAEFPTLELTANWDQEDSYDHGNSWGHICIETPDVYKACEELAAAGVNITRPPGPMKNGTRVIAFCEDPDGYKVELNESILKHLAKEGSGSMAEKPRLMKWDLVEDRYDQIGDTDSDTYIKPMVTSEFSKTMCGGINVLKNIKVPWDLTCDEIIYVLEGTFRLVCDGESYVCGRGDVLYIPKDNHISYEADDRCVIFYAAYPHNWKQLAGITVVPGIDPDDFVAG